MNETLLQILSYARGMWRYRWYAIALAWAISIVGMAMVMKMPDEYSASARIYVDTRTVLRPLLRGLAVDTGVGTKSQVQLMTRTLLSRPNIEKVLRMTDLDLSAKSPEEKEFFIDKLTRNVSVTSARRGPNLFTISYSDKDPQKSKRIVQSLLTIFVETSLGASRKDTDSAQRFLKKQIGDYEIKLNQADDRLKEFQRKHIGMMPGEGSGYFNRLQSSLAVLEEAKLALREAENRRDELKRQLEDEEPELNMFSGENVSSDSPRIQALQIKLDELLLKYTNKHPDVIEIKRTIAVLKRKEKQSGSSDKNEGDKTNPVFQQIKISLGEAEANAASLRTRVEEYKKRVDDLEKAVDTIPQIEAELKKLNRDYNVHKSNYTKLVSRLESAKMSQEAEETADTAKFKIIDPPHVPLSPSGPNRALLMFIGLVVGLGAGMVLALGMYLVKPTFDTRKLLSEVTNLPVLGSVSMLWTPGQIQERRRDIVMFSIAGLGLFIVYGLALSLQLILSR